MTRPDRIHRSDRTRGGMISVVMLIGLIVLGFLSASLLKRAMGRQTLARIAENVLQANVLADSGLDRALTRLGAHADYRGEVWEIPAADLGGRAGGRVTIAVEQSPDRPDHRRLIVHADYFIARPGPIRQSRTLDVSLPPVTR